MVLRCETDVSDVILDLMGVVTLKAVSADIRILIWNRDVANTYRYIKPLSSWEWHTKWVIADFLSSAITLLAGKQRTLNS